MKGTTCPIDILATRKAACLAVADEVDARIRSGAVLGLPTGSVALPLYQEWIRRHRIEGLSFRGTTTFSTDEYEGCGRGEENSRNRPMHYELFSKVRFGRNLMLSGHFRSAEEEAASYERQIKGMGGIDWQLLTVAPDGSLGFNEPGSSGDSRSRRVALSSDMRRVLSSELAEGEEVPAHAMTMGIATLLEAKRIVVIGWGSESAAAIRQALQGPVSEACPASFLQLHGNVRIVLAEVDAIWS
ncbi:glucosamine-6-phosphate deaminase [Haloferula sp.]|uniref:glucosamine-6-phosphate deaminase n=1 Tax=Haloferula sp. TaxID=2497595 RepID=UPI003C746359